MSTFPWPARHEFYDAEFELVRPSGSLILTARAHYGTFLGWEVQDQIAGPCGVRSRHWPDGQWEAWAWFPEGYPGPYGDWPDDARYLVRP